jgi:hypothetical protein
LEDFEMSETSEPNQLSVKQQYDAAANGNLKGLDLTFDQLAAVEQAILLRSINGKINFVIGAIVLGIILSLLFR